MQNVLEKNLQPMEQCKFILGFSNKRHKSSEQNWKARLLVPAYELKAVFFWLNARCGQLNEQSEGQTLWSNNRGKRFWFLATQVTTFHSKRQNSSILAGFRKLEEAEIRMSARGSQSNVESLKEQCMKKFIPFSHLQLKHFAKKANSLASKLLVQN